MPPEARGGLVDETVTPPAGSFGSPLARAPVPEMELYVQVGFGGCGPCRALAEGGAQGSGAGMVPPAVQIFFWDRLVY